MNTKTLELRLRKFKSEYVRLVPSEDMHEAGWSALRSEIAVEERQAQFRIRLVRYAVIVVSIVLIVLAGTTGVAVASWRAQPGDFLYPMKTFSEEVLSVVLSGQQEEGVSELPEDGSEATPADTPEVEEVEISQPRELPVGKENVVKETVKQLQEGRTEDGDKGIGKEVRGAATSVVQAVKEMVAEILENKNSPAADILP